MPDTVIVTIRWNGEEADFELPLKQSESSFADSLKEAVKNSFYSARPEGKELVLLWNGTAIPAEASLEECGIFDGEILELRLK